MCGRFVIYSNMNEWIEYFDLAQGPESLEPSYNIAPTQDIPMVRATASGERHMEMAHWGLIPRWAKEKKIGNRMINARAETAHEKPSFRNAFKQRRCLVPADGFYEWQRTGDHKQPYYISVAESPRFAIAGLWEEWLDREAAQTIQSVTLLTTAANAQMQPVHERMPVILPAAYFSQWLTPEPQDTRELQRLITHAQQTSFDLHPVSTGVNSPRNNSVRLIQAE